MHVEVWDSFSQAFLLLSFGVCLGLELVFAWPVAILFCAFWIFLSITKCRCMKLQGEGQDRCTDLLASTLHLYL